MIPAWVLTLVSTLTKAAVAGALEAWGEWQERGKRAVEEAPINEDHLRADRLRVAGLAAGLSGGSASAPGSIDSASHGQGV